MAEPALESGVSALVGRCGGEGARYWLQVRAWMRDRCVDDVLVCDGLTGLPDARPQCGRRRLCTLGSCTRCATTSAPTPGRAGTRSPGRSTRLPGCDGLRSRGAVPGIWAGMRPEVPADPHDLGKRLGASSCRSCEFLPFVPFVPFGQGIRRIVCTTNAIESVHARVRKAVRARRHFPNEQSGPGFVHLAVMALDPNGKGGPAGPDDGNAPPTPSKSPSTPGSPQVVANPLFATQLQCQIDSPGRRQPLAGEPEAGVEVLHARAGHFDAAGLHLLQ